MSIYNKIIIGAGILAAAVILCAAFFMLEAPEIAVTHKGMAVSKTVPYRVNLNTADIYELSRVGGLGDAKAERIIELRESFVDGKFFSVEEITKVDGITWAWLDEWQDYLYVE